ncbi:MAG: hypothetical protein ACI8QC_000745 [Planctomycetota bacterium]|jgi:hypothetical protein
MLRLPLAPLVLLTLFSCQAAEPEATETVQVVLEGAGKLGGCAVGELDASAADEEIVAVGSDGRIHLGVHGVDGWTSSVVDTVPGEQIQVAAGAIGPEGIPSIVSVGVAEGGEDDGGPGVAWWLRRDGDSWTRTELLGDDALLHAVAIGELDATSAGNEVVLAGFTRKVHLVRLVDGAPQSQTIGELPGNAKGIAIGAGGVVVACDDGSLVRFTGGADAWEREILAHHDAPLARLSANDDAVIYCGNDGVLRLWEKGESRKVYTSSDRLRGAVFLPDIPIGREVASAGYDGHVRRHAIDHAHGKPHSVAHEDAKLHNLATGTCAGSVGLAFCGYGGRLVWIGIRP